MSVRMRHTSSHTRNRRSHHALKNKVIVKDKESGNLRLPHRLDEATGMYRGKLIVAPKVKKDSKKEKAKKSEKEEHEAGVREPVHADHVEHKEKDEKKPVGLIGRMMKGKAKARSGMGGGA